MTLASITLSLCSGPVGAERSSVYSDRQFLFPGGLSRALILSYDDGPSQDRRLIRQLNDCGIKGTFHLNSGRLGEGAEWMADLIGKAGSQVDAAEVHSLYAGHEVASHSVNHPAFTSIDDEVIQQEVNRDIQTLSRLAGYPVENLAYPFGDFDDRVVASLANTPVTSARTVQDTGKFEIPHDFLHWHPTIHHSKALGLIDAFLATDTSRPTLFMIWGHSWEFDGDKPDNNWSMVSEMCRRLGGRDDIWYVTMGPFIRYLEAVMNLKFENGRWFNRSSQPVWIMAGKDPLRLSPERDAPD